MFNKLWDLLYYIAQQVCNLLSNIVKADAFELVIIMTSPENFLTWTLEISNSGQNIGCIDQKYIVENI